MKKAIILGSALSLAAVLAPASMTPAVADEAASAADPASHTVTIQYSGSVMIFQVADIVVSGTFNPDTYQASARFTAAGLAALFTDADIEAGVSGYRTGAQLQPWRYSHMNHASSKNRTVGINFPDGVATADINPPFGSMGEPPATEEERAGAADPLTTLLSVGLGAVRDGDVHCEGTMPVFDGKARYNLRFEYGGMDSIRTRAWSGRAAVCHAYYEPIAGYDADEFPSEEDIDRPITMWFAPVNGGQMHVPVRIRANAGFGGATVTAQYISAG